MLTSRCAWLHVDAGLGQDEGLDAELGQALRREAGAGLQAVVPAGEQEVRMQADQFFQGEVVATRRRVPGGSPPGTAAGTGCPTGPSPVTPKVPTMRDSRPSASMSSVVLMSLETARVGRRS